MTLRAKHFFWKQKAEKLLEHLDEIHYGEYDRTQLLALREMTNIIYPVRSLDKDFRKKGFSLGTEPYDVFERLEDSFYMGTVEVELNLLLHEYERYEILAVLVKMN
jgi:hypothetical protein